MIIIDSIIQGSDEWIKEKLGTPSASRASEIITSTGGKSTQRAAYMEELAGEAITGKKEEKYKSSDMSTGNEREEESRNLYELINGVEVAQVGLIYKDEQKKFLCSPDGIINNDYGLELKNVKVKTQVKSLKDDKLPTKHFVQVQSSLYVTDFEFWDFMSYAPGLRPLCVRCYRDEPFIKKFEVELEVFCIQLRELIEKIK